MHYNTAIIAFAACASAVQIQSKLQAEDIVDNIIELGENIYEFGEVAIVGFENLGEDIADFGEDALDFADDFFYTVGESTAYIFSKEFGEDLLWLGEEIFLDDFFVDGFDFLSDASNWESFGNAAL